MKLLEAVMWITSITIALLGCLLVDVILSLKGKDKVSEARRRIKK
jgi:hypothetical protein